MKPGSKIYNGDEEKKAPCLTSRRFLFRKNQKTIRKFGKLPEIGLLIKEDDHWANLFSCYVKTNDDKTRIIVVYVNNPVIQIYKDYKRVRKYG